MSVDVYVPRTAALATEHVQAAAMLRRRIASRPFGELEAQPLSVVFEATYGWSWFADLLADVGIEAHMAHPLATNWVVPHPALRYGFGRLRNGREPETRGPG